MADTKQALLEAIWDRDDAIRSGNIDNIREADRLMEEARLAHLASKESN